MNLQFGLESVEKAHLFTFHQLRWLDSGLEYLLSRWLTHLTGKSTMVVGRLGPQIPLLVCLSMWLGLLPTVVGELLGK